MCSFYTLRSKKCKISVKSSVSFYAFGTWVPKSYSKNVDEIDIWSTKVQIDSLALKKFDSYIFESLYRKRIG